jgi:hypothetical protein
LDTPIPAQGCAQPCPEGPSERVLGDI